MTLFDYLDLHPYWSFIYLSIIMAGLSFFRLIVVKIKHYNEPE